AGRGGRDASGGGSQRPIIEVDLKWTAMAAAADDPDLAAAVARSFPGAPARRPRARATRPAPAARPAAAPWAAPRAAGGPSATPGARARPAARPAGRGRGWRA